MPIVQTHSRPKPKHSFLGSSSRWGRLWKYDEFCPEEGRLKVQKKNKLKLKNYIQTAENNSLDRWLQCFYLPPKETQLTKVITWCGWFKALYHQVLRSSLPLAWQNIQTLTPADMGLLHILSILHKMEPYELPPSLTVLVSTNPAIRLLPWRDVEI